MLRNKPLSVSTSCRSLLIGASALGLVSCGSSDPDSPAQNTTPAFSGAFNEQPAATANSGQPETGTCTPGGVSCDASGGVATCNAAGSATSVAACPTGQRCDPSSNLCAVSTAEGVNGDAAFNNDQSQEASAANAIPCTPNLAWCQGSVLNRCSRDGQSIAETQCGACGDIGGVFACLDEICQPSAVACDGPTRIGTCSADGTQLSTVSCADGTACENATCVPVQCNTTPPTGYNNAQVTVYWFGQGTNDFGDISCGFGINSGDPNNGTGDSVNGIANPELFGAMNTADYRGASACGTCVNLSEGGRTVNITIVDECPLNGAVPNPICTPGHIDLGRAAWNALTGGGQDGIRQVAWEFAPCETNDVVSFELKEPDNLYWNEVLVRNHRFEIERLEIEMAPGEWVDAVRQAYNYWHPPVGDPDGGDMGTYRVRAWDINGGAVEAQLELRGGPQPAANQFSCQ